MLPARVQGLAGGPDDSLVRAAYRQEARTGVETRVMPCPSRDLLRLRRPDEQVVRATPRGELSRVNAAAGGRGGD